VSNFNSDNVSVFLGNGDGTFQAAKNFPAGRGPTFVVVGDFNRDNVPDLAVPNVVAETVSVLLGNGDGTFQAPMDFPGGSGPSSLAVGDFNGDWF
jgi:FG-GAP-like repeat